MRTDLPEAVPGAVQEGDGQGAGRAGAVALLHRLVRAVLAPAEALPVTVAPSALWLTIAAYALVAAAVPVLYALFRLNLYADGGYFSFALLTGRSWEFLWANFPGRLATYVLAIRPPELWLARTGDADAALRLYALLFGGLPLLGLLASLLALPRDRWAELVWPAFAFLTAGLLVLGFPTEVWLSFSLFWPLLFALRHGRGGLAGLLGTGLLMLGYVFSHEGMVLGLPVLALAWGRRLGDPAQRGAALRLLPVLVGPLLLWASAKAVLVPPDPLTVAAIAGNRWELIDPRRLLNNVILQKAALAASAGGLVWGALVWRGLAWRRALLPALLVALLAAAALVPAWGLQTLPRYWSRTYVLLALPALGLLALAVRIVPRPAAVATGAPVGDPMAGAAGRTAVDATPVLALVPLMLVLHLGEGAKFLRAWTAFLTDYAGVTAGGPGPVGRPDLAVFPPAPRGVSGGDASGGRSADATGAAASTVPAGGRPVWRVDWSWVLPFLAVPVAPDRNPRALVYWTTQSYSPIDCRQAGSLVTLDTAPAAAPGATPGTAPRPAIGPAGAALLRDFVCARRP